MPGPLLLFDADCGFCQSAVRWAPRLRLGTDVRAMQDVDLVGLGVDPERAERELPFLGIDDEVAYGHRAVAGALRTGNGAVRIVGHVIGSSLLDRPMAAAYGWTVRHRGSLPGATASCALPPAGDGL